MKKNIIKTTLLLILITLHVACSGDDTTTVIQDVILNNTELTLYVTDKHKLQVTSGLQNNTITWSSDNEDIVSVDEEGNLVAKNSGKTIVTATVGNKTANCIVNVNVTLFISGYEYDANNEVGKAKLWINDQVAELGNDFANGIRVYDGKTYVVGSKGTDGFTSTAKLWVDAEETNLSNFGTYATATGIFIKDSDIYVSGQIEGSSNSIATYWKNGVRTDVTDGNHQAWAYNIFVSASNEVYVAGTEANDNLISIAKVWKDGVPTSLGVAYSSANSVFVDGNNIYVAGREYDAVKRKYKATLWKNGAPTYLTTGHFHAEIKDITVSDDIVYAVGYSVDNSLLKKQATLWVNGFSTYLTDGTFNALATAVKIFNSDVYVIGRMYNGTKYNGIVWKNGVIIKTIDEFSNDINLTDLEIR